MPWCDIDLTNLLKFPQADNGSALASSVDAAGAVYLFCISSQQLHVGIYNSSNSSLWNTQTITLPSGTKMAVGTELSAFFDPSSVHLLYDALDPNITHVHLLSKGILWPDQPLNSAQVNVGSGLSGFQDASVTNLFYIDSTNDVHYWSYNSGTGASVDLDLTISATPVSEKKIPNAATGSGLSSFNDSNGYHVFYIGSDNNVHQLYYDNGAWSDLNLTISATAISGKKVNVVTGSGISSFADQYGEHVFYVGTDLHMHHLNYTGNSWTDTDLTAKTAGPNVWSTSSTASAVSSFGDGYGIHILYISSPVQHVHQLYFDNATWVDQDLTGTATPMFEGSSVPLPTPGSALSSLADNYGEQVFYITTDQHIHMLSYPSPLGALQVTCPANGEVEVNYNSGFSPSGGVPPYTYAVPSGSTPPPGLNFNKAGNTAGTLTGKPTAAGSHPFSVIVTDANGTKVTCNCTIVIAPQVALSCPTPSTCVAGQPYTSSVIVSGGVAQYKYTITAGSLPQGLGLNSSNEIVGTPEQSGTFNFTLTVTDGAGGTATISCHITINAAPVILNVGCPPAGVGYVNVPYNSGLVITGGSGSYNCQCQITPSSGGLSMNTSGVVSGTPKTAGTYILSGTVTDKNNSSAVGNIQCTITIYSVSLGCPPNSGTCGQEYNYQLAVTGGVPNTGYTYHIATGSLPPPLTLSTSGLISGTPNAIGTYNFTVSVSGTNANGTTTIIATSGGCVITITGTFVVKAVEQSINSQGVISFSPFIAAQFPDGSFGFVDATTGADVPANQGPNGTYTIPSLPSTTTALALSPFTLGNNYWLCPGGGSTEQINSFPVTMSGCSGSTTIYVSSPTGFVPK